jgi:hypothetical protein
LVLQLRHFTAHIAARLYCMQHTSRTTNEHHTSLTSAPLHPAPTAYPGTGIFPSTGRSPRRDRARGAAGSSFDLIHTVRLHLPSIQTPQLLPSLIAYVRTQCIIQARYSGLLHSFVRASRLSFSLFVPALPVIALLSNAANLPAAVHTPHSLSQLSCSIHISRLGTSMLHLSACFNVLTLAYFSLT